MFVLKEREKKSMVGLVRPITIQFQEKMISFIVKHVKSYITLVFYFSYNNY